MFKRRYFLYAIVAVIMVLGGTLAYYAWASNIEDNTNISLEIEGIYLKFYGGTNITGFELIPTLTNDSGIRKEVSAKMITEGETSRMNLLLKVNQLGEGLKDESFVWEVYKGNTLINSGNFSEANNDDVITLADNP